MIIVFRAVFQRILSVSFLRLIFVQIIKMLYYDGIDVSEGIYVDKTRASKKCDICDYWYFLNSVSTKCLQ